VATAGEGLERGGKEKRQPVIWVKEINPLIGNPIQRAKTMGHFFREWGVK